MVDSLIFALLYSPHSEDKVYAIFEIDQFLLLLLLDLKVVHEFVSAHSGLYQIEQLVHYFFLYVEGLQDVLFLGHLEIFEWHLCGMV